MGLGLLPGTFLSFFHLETLDFGAFLIRNACNSKPANWANFLGILARGCPSGIVAKSMSFALVKIMILHIFFRKFKATCLLTYITRT